MERFKLGTINAIRGDCMDFMIDLPDKYFDLAIVDPPYGINVDNMSMGQTKTSDSTARRIKKGRLNSGGGKLKNRLLNQSDASWDIAPDQSYFDQLFRVSKRQIVWGGNYFDLPPTRGIICWDKRQPWTNFSQFELAWTSFNKPARLYSLGSRGGSNVHRKIHPTQKPVQLYKWLLNDYASKNDLILDTHGGSFSHAIASHDLGFALTIIEKDESYFNAAIQRLKNHQMQQQIQFD